MGEQIVPKSNVADEQSVDGNGAAAAQNFVVVVPGLVRRSVEFKVALKRRVRMAKYGDGGDFNSHRVSLSKINEVVYLCLEFGKNERRIELETRILHAKTGNGYQPKAGGGEFIGSGGADENLKRVGGRMLANHTTRGRGVNHALFVLRHRKLLPRVTIQSEQASIHGPFGVSPASWAHRCRRP